MRCPSENFLSRVLTFHSISTGGFLDPPPKYMSYSTFSRRSWSSNIESSSSIAKIAAPFRYVYKGESNEPEYTTEAAAVSYAQSTVTGPHRRCSGPGGNFIGQFRPLLNK